MKPASPRRRRLVYIIALLTLATFVTAATLRTTIGFARPVVLADGRDTFSPGTRLDGSRYLVLLVGNRGRLHQLLAQTGLVSLNPVLGWRSATADPRHSGLDSTWAAEDAWVAVSRYLGEQPVTAEYLSVVVIMPSSPFFEAGLRIDDRIVAVDGVPMGIRAFTATVIDDPTVMRRLTILRGTDTMHIILPASKARFRPGMYLESHAVAAGAHLVARIPRQEIGPSSGLAHGLAMLEARTTGSLAGGRTVAATGVLDPHGRVWPVGGVRFKTRAAIESGASVIFVPLDAAGTARRAADGEIPVVPVSNLGEAVGWLCDHGGSGEVCDMRREKIAMLATFVLAAKSVKRSMLNDVIGSPAEHEQGLWPARVSYLLEGHSSP